MLGRLWQYLKNSICTGYHSVTRGYRRFLPFLCALFLIQTVLFGVTMAFDSHARTQEQTIREEYDYHLAIKGLSPQSTAVLREDPFTVFSNDYVYDVVRTVEHSSEYQDSQFDVYIRFVTGNKHYGVFGLFIPDTPKTCYSSFAYRYGAYYGGEDSTATLYFSPLYQLDELKRENRLLCTGVVAGGVLLFSLILGILYNIRLRQDRFAYGIYTTFGANARRLRSLAFYEMLICAWLTMLPAALLALLMSFLYYNSRGIPFSVGIPMQAGVALAMLPLLFLAVRLPMKLLSQEEPIKLIAAADNSDLVSTPHHSFALHRHRFPRFYEWLSTWRYRRHYLRLALCSALLCTLFVCSTYFANLYEVNREVRVQNTPAFSVSFADERSDPDTTKEQLLRLPGISDIYREHGVYSLAENAAFLAVSREDLLPLAGVMGSPIDPDSVVLNGASLLGTPNDDLLRLFSKTYHIEGDIGSVLREEHTIAIANTVGNRAAFDFEVGDTVRIATLRKTIGGLSDMLTGEALLEEQINRFVYEYHTFRIGAVITDYPTATEGVPIVMGLTDYTALTGAALVSDALSVSVEPDITPLAYLTLENQIRAIVQTGADIRVEAHNSYFENRMEAEFGYGRLMLYAGSLILLFLPLTWFFSQLFFYRKRSQEFSILRAMLAPMRQIRALHLQSALIMLPIALFSLIAALLCILLVHLLVRYVIPTLFLLSGAVILPLTLSPIPYLVCFLATFLCSFLSALLPYLHYRHRQLSDPMEYFDTEEGL